MRFPLNQRRSSHDSSAVKDCSQDKVVCRQLVPANHTSNSRVSHTYATRAALSSLEAGEEEQRSTNTGRKVWMIPKPEGQRTGVAKLKASASPSKSGEPTSH